MVSSGAQAWSGAQGGLIWATHETQARSSVANVVLDSTDDLKEFVKIGQSWSKSVKVSGLGLPRPSGCEGGVRGEFAKITGDR